jgi:DNA repair exonuclease SbcCD ATPase subunit
MTPAVDPKIAEDMKKLQEQLLATQKELKTWRQESLDSFERQKTELAKRLEERLNALEKQPHYSEKTMIQHIQESLQKEIASIRPPAAVPVVAPENTWDVALRGKEKKLQALKAELAQVAAVSLPTAPPVATPLVQETNAVEEEPVEPQNPRSLPTAALFIEKADDVKKHLAQESTYATSSRSTSLFTKLWLYLNEPAIEIPMKNSKESQ